MGAIGCFNDVGEALGCVIEEVPLDRDAFKTLAAHVGVHAVVVEAVWRWVIVLFHCSMITGHSRRECVSVTLLN